jgi:hypothetical protein
MEEEEEEHFFELLSFFLHLEELTFHTIISIKMNSKSTKSRRNSGNQEQQNS